MWVGVVISKQRKQGENKQPDRNHQHKQRPKIEKVLQPARERMEGLVSMLLVFFCNCSDNSYSSTWNLMCLLFSKHSKLMQLAHPLSCSCVNDRGLLDAPFELDPWSCFSTTHFTFSSPFSSHHFPDNSVTLLSRSLISTTFGMPTSSESEAVALLRQTGWLAALSLGIF